MSEALLAMAAKANEVEDQTAEATFERRLAPEKQSIARLVSYIELGDQFKKGNPAYSTEDRYVPQVRLVFELLSQHNKYEIEVDGKKKEVYDRVTVTVNKSKSDKGSFKKLLKAMIYGRPGIEHCAQMWCVDSFFVTPVHTKAANGQTYVNLQKSNDDPWNVSAPTSFDPETGDTKKYKAKPIQGDVQLFLWDRPEKAMWDSLYIAGEYERAVYKEEEVDGKKKRVKTDEKETVSKNYLQETILKANNFEGSPVSVLLSGLGDLPVGDEEEEVEEVVDESSAVADLPEEETEEEADLSVLNL